MPGGDRRGPSGMGPRTGRGLGYCSGSDVPGAARGGGFGFGFGGRGGRGGRGGAGFGRGRGRGFLGRGGWWGAYPEAPNAAGERDALSQERAALASRMRALDAQLNSLDEEPAED